jgi:hypothetical protein
MFLLPRLEAGENPDALLAVNGKLPSAPAGSHSVSVAGPMGIAWMVVALLLFVQTTPVAAHHRSASHTVTTGAVLVPSISHDQMAVIANNKAAILALAERQPHADDVLKRLLSFVNTQFSFCLWGLIPGTVTDENSPFNECAHAYLAATRALLARMQATMSNVESVSALAAKIEREMLGKGTSLVLCRYSDEPFSTAQVVFPHWADVPFHLPTLLTFLSLLSLALMGASILSIVTRHSP